MPEAQGQAQAADPVSVIEGMLNAESAQATLPLAPKVAAKPEGDAPAEVPAEETPAEVPAGDNKTVEGEDAPADVPMAEIPLDQLEAIALDVKTKGEDGKDVVEKLTVKELREGYMKGKDYSRKTAEVARQREEVGEKVRQAIDSERTQYQQNLQQLHNFVIDSVAPELKDVNWNQLATDNPMEYVRIRNRADQITQVLANIESKQKEVSEKQKGEVSQARQKAAIEARTKLESEIPNWSDELYHELMKTGEAYGFKQGEVGSWVDARAIQVLHDAHQYRLLKAKTPLKVVVPPKVVKPGATQSLTQAQARAGAAMKRLQPSGRVEDAADVIASRM